MALTRFASNKLSASRPTLTSRANNAKRFTNIRANSLNISNPAIPSAYFIFTTATPALQEGISTTVTVQGYNLAVAAQNGIYYWTIESNAGDFDASSGSFTLTSAGNLYGYSAGSFTLTPTSDGISEGTETFTIAIRSESTSGPIISTSLPITINDQVPDTYFNYVTLLLSSNGVNNANNSVFVDSSTNNFAITRNGTPTQGSFTPPFENNLKSIYVGGGGSSGYLTPSNDGITLNGAFTFEAWVYLTTSGRNQIFGDAYGSAYFSAWGIGFIPGGQTYAPAITPGLVFTLGPQSGWGYNYAYGAGLGYPPTNQWVHVAICRDSNNNWHFYQNGVKGTTSNINADAHPYIQFPSNNGPDGSFVLPMNMFNYDGIIGGGNSDYMAAGFNGYLSDLRLVNGTALYTGASLTVPTSRLTAIQNTEVLLGKNGFVNTANTALKFTPTSVASITSLTENRVSPVNSTVSAYSAILNGGSAYFDGSGDYLQIAHNTALDFGTGDFSVEAWVYPTGDVAYSAVISKDNGNGTGWFMEYSATRGFIVYWASTTISSAAAYVKNSWSHLVFCRSGTTVSIYRNGTRLATATSSASISSANNIRIGAINGATLYEFPGYISNARIVKGSSPYNATQTTLTVPTAPVTAIANTQLLCNFTNAGIYDSAFGTNLETQTNAKISTTQSKFGGSSMVFDGSSALAMPYNPSLNFGSSNFTIEFWTYVTATPSAEQYFLAAGPAGGGGVHRGFRMAAHNGSAAGIYFYAGGIASNAETLLGSFPSTNAWHHIAIVRNGATITGYVDGTALGTTINASTTAITDIVSGDYSFVGALQGTAPNGRLFYNGYIDDLRITKGFARYTANFTPPALSFPTQ